MSELVADFSAFDRRVWCRLAQAWLLAADLAAEACHAGNECRPTSIQCP